MTFRNNSHIRKNPTGHSSASVSAYYGHFRQLVEQSLVPEDQIIRGPGIVVEVDETKLGKRKYNKGHKVDGVWVLAGIEHTEKSRIFLVPIEKRDGNTLITAILEHVSEGSILVTDSWKGYAQVNDELNFEYYTVNHSQTFKDPVTGACTNKVEGLNNGLKLKIAMRNRVKDGINKHLAEYIWRKKHTSSLLESFIDAIKNVHYDIE